jgi:predicted nucleic acid-binding protein
LTVGFLDTNVLVYHSLQNHPHHSPRCTALLLALAEGKYQAHCSSTVVLEAIYVLEKVYGVPRGDTYSTIHDLASIPSIQFDNRQAILDALEFWKDNTPLSFEDCFHLVLTKHLGLDSIYTFDKKMNRYPGVTRIES